jgi:hypothetical protein
MIFSSVHEEGGTLKKFVFVGLILLASICLFAGAQDSYVLKVKVQVANVRAEPDLNAQVIAQVKMGDLFEALNKTGAFFEITVTDKEGTEVTGYIHSGVVDVISGGATPKEPERAVREIEKPAPAEKARASSFPSESRAKKWVLRAGMTMSNVTISEALPEGFSKSSATGIRAGIGYEIGGPNFCIEIGAVYMPGGFKISGTYEDAPVNLSVAGKGIGASILAKFKFMPGSSPYVFGGADVGYLLSQKTTVTAGGDTESSTEMEGLNRLAYGLDFGAGYEFDLNGLCLLAEARYYLGLSNMIKDPEEGAYIKPNGITIGLGIKL